MNKQEAIEWLKSIRRTLIFEQVEAIDMAIEALSAERTGEWIVYPLKDEGRVELECPECGYALIRAADRRPHFCENCGAKMGGDDNG